jgi:hypothetical protein
MAACGASAAAGDRRAAAQATVRAALALRPALTYDLHRHVTRDSVSAQTKTTVRTARSSSGSAETTTTPGRAMEAAFEGVLV